MALLALAGCAPAVGALGGAAVGEQAADAPVTGAVVGGLAGAAIN